MTAPKLRKASVTAPKISPGAVTSPAIAERSELTFDYAGNVRAAVEARRVEPLELFSHRGQINPVRVSTHRIYTRLGREAGSGLHSVSWSVGPGRSSDREG